MEIKIAGTTTTGEPVWTYVDGDKSSHIHAGVEEVLAEAIGKISPEGGLYRTEVDLGRPVGKCNCVSTSGEDYIFYAQREERDGLTRFVGSRQAADTSLVSIVMCRDKKRGGRWTLITTFFGPLAPREPWDPAIRDEDERRAARKFWSSHALVAGSKPIISGTETTHCPW